MVIDRITIVADWSWDVRRRNNDGCYTHLYKALDKVMARGKKSFAKFPYRYRYTTEEGLTIEIADEKAPVPNLRIDFNPQTVLWERLLKPFSKSLVDVRVTRLDYAHDYDLDLSRVNFQLENRVKTIDYRSGTGKLETRYLGAKDSSLRFRIYDKAKEQKESGTKWRIEAQARFSPKEDWWFFLPFEKFVMEWPAYHNVPRVQDRALLQYLRTNPQAYHELAPNTRTRIKKLMSESSRSEIDNLKLHPHRIFQKEVIQLKNDVTLILCLLSKKNIYI